MIFTLMISLGSCELFFDEELEPVSTVTTYPIIELEGSSTMVLEVGTEFVEPGYSASIEQRGADDLTSEVQINMGGFDKDTPGLYSITYSAVNEFGYRSTARRLVLVTQGLGDLTNIAGTYREDLLGSTTTMQIEAGEQAGFWLVGNIRNRNVEFEQPAIIADLGDNTYIISETFFKRRIEDLEYVYLVGTAVFNETTGRITFTQQQIFEDGTPLGDPEVFSWIKQ